MENKKVAEKIFRDALESSLPKNFISQYCQLDDDTLFIGNDTYELKEYKNIYVFGSGKAAFTMAEEIEKLLGAKIKSGLIVAPKTEKTLEYIEVCEGTHPLPTQKSFDAGKKLLGSMQECEKDDLYIYLLSGGSSSLIESPIGTISLEDFQTTTQLMLHNALDIQEINCVRKHISSIKGGRLAESCKGKGIILVISDIIGNDLYSIGSGPMYADISTFDDAKRILEEKNIFDVMPKSVQDVLHLGINGEITETPKTPKGNLKHYIIASNEHALLAARKSAESEGMSVKITEEPMQGNVNEMIQKMLEIVEESKEDCILFGGECTVKVKGSGQGGRNQHAVALMLKEIRTQGLDICFLSAGTDGIDGNSDAAGAVINEKDCMNVAMKDIDKYIENFDSYSLLKKTQGLIMTGPSGTNVIDIAIIIKGE